MLYGLKEQMYWDCISLNLKRNFFFFFLKKGSWQCDMRVMRAPHWVVGYKLQQLSRAVQLSWLCKCHLQLQHKLFKLFNKISIVWTTQYMHDTCNPCWITRQGFYIVKEAYHVGVAKSDINYIDFLDSPQNQIMTTQFGDLRIYKIIFFFFRGGACMDRL